MKRLAVLGHPVSHSRSPAMHNAALANLGLADEWAYEAVDIAPVDFPDHVRGMKDDGFTGANVTVPHKQAALIVADEATLAAREIGAANTLSFTASGIGAENTDAPGLIDAIGEPVNGKSALLLGAGGAGRAVLWALNRAGARVAVWNRTESKAGELAMTLGGTLATSTDISGVDLIVNASAAGLGGEGGIEDLPIDPEGFSPGQIVVDMVYGDSPSSILAAAEAGGARTVDGLEVLVRQGAHSLRLWTGMDPDLDVMREAARG
ncbi:MAG: shikimate dehydrogenase [Solirubrobacterales bacterium]